MLGVNLVFERSRNWPEEDPVQDAGKWQHQKENARLVALQVPRDHTVWRQCRANIFRWSGSWVRHTLGQYLAFSAPNRITLKNREIPHARLARKTLLTY